MSKGIVFKIKKYALHDGPGIRTTIFMKGCPLNCWWCHNPEGLSSVPQMMNSKQGIVVGRHMSVEQVMAEIEKDLIFYDESGGGVTFSGGEPLMQPLFLEDLLEACARRGFHTAIDTCGYAPAKTFLRLSGMADLILFDIKLMDPALHLKYTGVENQLILDNFQALCRNQTKIWARLPIIPGITDSDDNIHAVATQLNECNALQRIDLLPYHRIGQSKYQRFGMEAKMHDVSPPSKEAIKSVQTAYEHSGLTVNIGG